MLSIIFTILAMVIGIIVVKVVPNFPNIWQTEKPILKIVRNWTHDYFFGYYDSSILQIYVSNTRPILYQILRQHKLEFSICFMAILLGRLFNVISPILSKWTMDSVFKEEFGWHFLVMTTLLSVFETFVTNCRTYEWQKIENAIQMVIQTDLVQYIHRLSYKTHQKLKPHEISRSVHTHADHIYRVSTSLIFDVVPSLLDLVVALFYANLCWEICILLVLSSVVFIRSNVLLINKREEAVRNRWDMRSRFGNKMSDGINKHEVVKYFNGEENEILQCQNLLKVVHEANHNEQKSRVAENLLTSYIVDISIFLSKLLIIYYISRKAYNMTVGDYTLITSYISRFYSPLRTFRFIYSQLQISFVELKKSFPILSEEVEEDESGCLELPDELGSIEFKNVLFGFEPEKPILNGVSFKIESGETVAIVGPSGAGKTTIYNLMFRFLDNYEGSIEINGVDIRNYTRKSIRKNFGTVPQFTQLFNDTIAYNIRYGRMDATQEEVEEAAKAASINEAILGKKDGYDSLLGWGDGAINLSGGERQRLAIARVFLKNPKYLLLDEATSSLDIVAERAVKASFDSIRKGRTTLLIAHRLTTVAHSDKILVLKDGQIIERGSHKELLDLDGYYAMMWNQQFEALANKAKFYK